MERKFQVGQRKVTGFEHGKIGCRQIVLLEDHFGDNLVQGKGMGKGAGANVGNTNHLQDTRHMRITGLALDAVGKVEDKPGPLPLQDLGHKVFQVVDKVLVAFQGDNLVAALFQGVGYSFDCLDAVFLPVRHTEQVDDLFTLPVIDDCYFHGIYLFDLSNLIQF